MSIIKTGAVQVGKSNTASDNFHWRNLLDGLLRLSRGNAGSPITDVMRVRADNSVEFPGGVSSGVLGAGQTRQDLTGSRAIATTYVHTGKVPKHVSVGLSPGTANAIVLLYIGGAEADRYQAYVGNSSGSLQGIVQPGENYVVVVTTGSVTIGTWVEVATL